MEIPAISVIIPMYNSEKYIAECLNSILVQTFQNFEVIVVDDCSTDNSVEIAKSYEEKFDGRLKIFKTKKNSNGGGYVPRNLGLNLSCGKYIFFVDSDDFIIETALEELFSAAEQTKADVVYTGSYYLTSYNGKNFLQIDSESIKLLKNGLENNPTLTINDPNKNLNLLINEDGNFRNPWTKFVLRNFLIENEIVFPKIKSGGDYIWVIQVYCHAKRLLRIPNAVYIYRNYSAESVTRKNRTPKEQIFHWVSAFILWLQALEELSNQTEILQRNPNYCYFAAINHFDYCLERFITERMKLSNDEIYKTLCDGFSAKNIFSNLTVPFLFSVIDFQQKDLTNIQQEYKDLAAQAQQRIVELENEIKRLKSIK